MGLALVRMSNRVEFRKTIIGDLPTRRDLLKSFLPPRRSGSRFRRVDRVAYPSGLSGRCARRSGRTPTSHCTDIVVVIYYVLLLSLTRTHVTREDEKKKINYVAVRSVTGTGPNHRPTATGNRHQPSAVADDDRGRLLYDDTNRYFIITYRRAETILCVTMCARAVAAAGA